MVTQGESTWLLVKVKPGINRKSISGHTGGVYMVKVKSGIRKYFSGHSGESTWSK